MLHAWVDAGRGGALGSAIPAAPASNRACRLQVLGLRLHMLFAYFFADFADFVDCLTIVPRRLASWVSLVDFALLLYIHTSAENYARGAAPEGAAAGGHRTGYIPGIHIRYIQYGYGIIILFYSQVLTVETCLRNLVREFFFAISSSAGRFRGENIF